MRTGMLRSSASDYAVIFSELETRKVILAEKGTPGLFRFYTFPLDCFCKPNRFTCSGQLIN